MATLIQAWRILGPRLACTKPITPEAVIEQLVLTTGQSRGRVSSQDDPEQGASRFPAAPLCPFNR